MPVAPSLVGLHLPNLGVFNKWKERLVLPLTSWVMENGDVEAGKCHIN